ncbi:putative transcription factor B3-Domain family [Helianthus anomalus]
MFQTYGPTSFFLMVFKSCVHKNMFISKINPHEDVIVMADEFWRQFYGKTFKGGQSTLYLGDRFWNVNMDDLSDSCVFSHGCSEMINELALDRRSTFVFSLHGNKIFELSVFNHQTGTQIQNNRVELVVLDDPIYVDDCVEFAFEDQDDAKFDTFFSSLLEMEDLKKKFKENWDSKTEGKGKSSGVCDVDSTMKDDPKAKTVVNEDISLKDKSMSDPKAKTVVNVNEDISLKVVFVLLKLLFVKLTEFVYIILKFMFCFFQDKSMSDMDLDSFLIPKNVMVYEPSLCSTVVSDAPKKCKAVIIQSHESVIAHRTRSKFGKKRSCC